MVQGDAALLSVQPSGEGFRHLQAVSKEASIKRIIRARRSKLLVKDWCHWTVRGNELLCGRWLATDGGALIWKNMQNVLFTHVYTILSVVLFLPWCQIDEFIQGQLGGFLEACLFVCLLLTFLWVRGTAIRHIRCRPCGDRIPATMSMWSSICVEAVWSVVIC